MSVNNVTSNSAQVAQTTQTNQAAQTSQAAQQTQNGQQTSQNGVEVASDEYAGSVPKTNAGTYNSQGYKVDMSKIDQAKSDMKNNNAAFKAMVEAANKKGNNKTGGVHNNSKDADYWSDFVYNQLGKQYSVSEAQELVADDGYWGVEQTSQRIVDFAKNLAGDDIEKFDTLMSAIEKGFGAAKDDWGGKMPDITKKTYDAVMEKMNAWKEEANASKVDASQQATQTSETTKNQNTVTENAVNATEGAMK